MIISCLVRLELIMFGCIIKKIRLLDKSVGNLYTKEDINYCYFFYIGVYS